MIVNADSVTQVLPSECVCKEFNFASNTEPVVQGLIKNVSIFCVQDCASNRMLNHIVSKADMVEQV